MKVDRCRSGTLARRAPLCLAGVTARHRSLARRRRAAPMPSRTANTSRLPVAGARVVRLGWRETHAPAGKRRRKPRPGREMCACCHLALMCSNDMIGAVCVGTGGTWTSYAPLGPPACSTTQLVAPQRRRSLARTTALYAAYMPRTWWVPVVPIRMRRHSCTYHTHHDIMYVLPSAWPVSRHSGTK